MEPRHTLIALGLIIAAIIAANTSACNPPAHTASTSQQAKQICDEVYADSEDAIGYGDCISSAKRRLEKY
ncbi:hypothetical protein HZF02_23865 [Pseudomonas yamanorum]|nr:hypothetical protein HZF02_23865 [Pseudomonas yamanorum]